MKHFSLNGLKMTLIVYSVESERGRKSENETKVNEVNVSSFQSHQIFSNNICRLR